MDPQGGGFLTLQTWRLQFPLQFEELAPEIRLTLSTCKELNESKDFEKLLHHILSIGNYLNGGSNLGAAHGYLLKSLTKLADARGMPLERGPPNRFPCRLGWGSTSPSAPLGLSRGYGVLCRQRQSHHPVGFCG